MLQVTKEQIITALETVGIENGDGLLVHSAIQFLGFPEGGIGMYLEALREVIGSQGTIAVPTFNFAFARGEKYNPRETPSFGMGSFSEYVRQQPAAQRTTHPMQSLAIIGYHRNDIVNRDTPSAFDPDSAFERMLQLGFKILLLGADINAISFLHYSEQRAPVPYRYWKDFTGDYKTDTGWQTRTYRMYVRDLEINPRIDLKPVQQRLQKQGAWSSVQLNYGYISQCRVNDFVNAVDYFLVTDPWSLVTNH